MVNSVTSSGEEDWGRLCGVIAPFTSGLYDFVQRRQVAFGCDNSENDVGVRGTND